MSTTTESGGPATGHQDSMKRGPALVAQVDGMRVALGRADKRRGRVLYELAKYTRASAGYIRANADQVGSSTGYM